MKRGQRARLDDAVQWHSLQHFLDASFIVKSYQHYFNVNETCALEELNILGVLDDKGRKRTVSRVNRKKRGKTPSGVTKKYARMLRQARFESYDYETQDDQFFYIAGYTAGGFAYGITWEEYEQMNYMDSLLEALPPEEIDEEAWCGPDESWDLGELWVSDEMQM